MCTVSYVNTAAGVVITSNRDEHVLRSAEFPQTHMLNGKEITYPKDPLAGGTWFAIANQIGRVVVLLNGAETKHQRANSYRKSRGLVLLDLISADDAVCANWQRYDLQQIEPFTLVVYENRMLFQLRWDGNTKSNFTLDTSCSYIWSSATLYSPDVCAQRQSWFAEFLNQHTTLTPSDMMRFHASSPTSDKQSNLLMERTPELKTISITQAIVGLENSVLQHSDLLSEETETYTYDRVQS